VLRNLHEKFLSKENSIRIAESRLSHQGVSYDDKDLETMAAAIRQEWKDIGDESTNFGHKIHDVLRQGVSGTSTNLGEHYKMYKDVLGYLNGFYNHTEFIIPDEKSNVCGTADVVIQRNRSSSNCICDIADYKTNLRKGIVFDSTYTNKFGVKVSNGKFMYGPVAHLEDCNYNQYALQLSLYAYMLERNFNVRIGKLFILWLQFVRNEATQWIYYKTVYLPVPYLHYEAIAILKEQEEMLIKQESPGESDLNFPGY
jgi:hypothetical protein